MVLRSVAHVHGNSGSGGGHGSGQLPNNCGGYTGLLFHPLRRKGFGILGQFGEPDCVVFHELPIIALSFDQLLNQTQSQGAVGSGFQIGVEIRLSSDRRHSRIHDDQFGPGLAGPHDHLGHVGVGMGRVGSPDHHAAGVLVIRYRPAAFHQAVSEVAAVVAHRVIGEVVGTAQSVDEAPGHVLLLSKTDRLSLPDADRPRSVFVFDGQQSFGDLIESLLEWDFFETPLCSLERLEESLRMIDHVHRGSCLDAQPASVPGMFLIAVDIDDLSILQIHIDGAAVVAHAAQGLDCFSFGHGSLAPSLVQAE